MAPLYSRTGRADIDIFQARGRFRASPDDHMKDETEEEP